MPPHPLTDFEIQEYYWNETKFNGVHLRNNLPKIEDGACVINLDEAKLLGTHLMAYMNSCNLAYFDSFEVKDIPKEIKNFIDNKNIKTNN